MYKILFSNILFLILSSQLSIIAQSKGFCGSGLIENHLIRERMIHNRDVEPVFLQRTGAIKYVPLNYLLTAKADGTGRLRYIKVLENICEINKIFQDQEISFYLKGIVDINNTFLYDDPSSTFGIAEITKQNKLYKNSINLFVASKANVSNPGVLAFYSPNGDYLVSEAAQVSTNGYILAHEIGHYLSLAHTFYGWETTTYDCSQACPTSVSLGNINVAVEYVDRELLVNGKKHCLNSADGFCDTPADYNCGFGFNGCKWNGCFVDPENKGLDPDEANIMSYFLNNCHRYFSAEQKDAMARDYASAQRSHLKTPVHNPLPPVTEAPGSPSVDIKGYNSVSFKWNAVPNATHYILEYATVNLSNNSTYKNYIITRTDTTITNLTKGLKYQWRVTAFNFSNPCPKSIPTQLFNNSNFAVATDDHELVLDDVNILYLGDNKISINLNSNKASELYFNLFSIDGKFIHRKKIQIEAGSNNIINSLENSGIFIYQLQTNTNSFSGKLFAF